MIEESLRVQRDCGIASRPLPLPPAELAQRLPAVDRRQVKSAMIFDDGGTAPHQPS